MNTQFVLISPEGKGVEWIDPVESFEETENHWIIDNTYHVYRLHKNNFIDHTYELRIGRRNVQ